MLDIYNRPEWFCDKCDLGCHWQSGEPVPAVLGEGPEDADIMVVGYRPNLNDMHMLRPFQGEDGLLLDRELLKVGINRSECRSTYLVKHAPPPAKKGKVTAKQITACSELLKLEFDVVKPNLVIALGGAAAKFFTGEGSVQNQRGLPIQLGPEFNDAQLLVTFQPSAMKFNDRILPTFQSDLRVAREMVDGTVFEPTETRVIKTMADWKPFLEKLAETSAFAWDLETTGLDPYTGEVTDIVLSNEDGIAYIIPVHYWQWSEEAQEQIDEHGIFELHKKFWDSGTLVPYAEPEVIDFFAALLRNHDIDKITHGGCFDYKWAVVKEWCEIPDLKSWAFDTLYGHSALMDEHPPHNLEYVAGTWTNMPAWDELKREYQAYFGKDKIYLMPLKDREAYGGGDGDATWRLGHIIPEEASKDWPAAMDFWHGVVRGGLPVITEMMVSGMRVDPEQLDVVREIFKAQLIEVEAEMRRVLKCDEDVNLNSPAQVLPYVQALGIKFPDHKWYKTDAGDRFSLRAPVREALSQTQPHELWAVYKDYSKLSKMIGSFVGPSNTFHLTKECKNKDPKSIPAKINPITGRIHCDIKPQGARTGRRSHSDPNLAQAPKRRDEGSQVDPSLVRTVFLPNEDHHVIVKCDFDGAEFWYATYRSKDPEMMLIYDNGLDIHSKTAASIYDIDYDEFIRGIKEGDDEITNMRLKAKIMNFGGILYGGGPAKIGRDINVTEAKAKKLMGDVKDLFSGFMAWQKQQVQFVYERGWVETAYGRRRHLSIPKDMPDFLRGHVEREAVNSPIQGTVGDHMLKIMPRVHSALHSHHEGAIILEMHDELLASVARDEAEEFLPRMIEAMTLDVPGVGKPMPVSGDIVERWKPLKKAA
jgi:DNA polymerase-1